MKKRETRKFNRKIRKAKEQAREQALKEVREKLLKMIPISQQVIDCLEAGAEVNISNFNIKASDYLEILKMH